MFLRSNFHAYRSLDHLAQSWQLVQDSVASPTWDRIQGLRQAGKCRHVIVHDKSVSMAMPTHVRRAIDHYGVDIAVLDKAEV
jgi:hypothetical protein